jgi:hypothetical protein
VAVSSGASPTRSGAETRRTRGGVMNRETD